MIPTNTMQRGTDEFSFRRQALLRTTQPFDLTGETSCSGFEISGTEPAGTSRRIIFEVDGVLYYFNKGDLTQYPSYGELADVLQYGNTVAELLEVEGIVQWINKKVYPIIALDAPRDAEVMPKIKIGLKVKCFNDEYQRQEFSPVFELKHSDNPARITNAVYNKANNGLATSNSQIRIRDLSGNWSDWTDYDAAISKTACAVQFQNSYTLTTLDGSDEAKTFDHKVAYVTNADNLAGDVQEIILQPQTLDYPPKVCYALIKHSELFDAKIKAYVCLKSSTSQRENIIIGKGTGALSTYFLGVQGGIDKNINQNTLHITAGDINITDFYYNMENATVDLVADVDAEIKATYDYEVDEENWIELAGQLPEIYGDSGLYVSRFVGRLNSDNKIVAVKLRLQRDSGSVTDEEIGVATGNEQIFVLPHRAKSETLKCKGSWSYDEETQLLKVTGILNDTLNISYDFCGIIPQVDSIIIGFSYAV